MSDEEWIEQQPRLLTGEWILQDGKLLWRSYFDPSGIFRPYWWEAKCCHATGCA